MVALILALTLQVVAENAKLPHLAFDADGNAYVALVRGGNIELAVSTDGGKTFTTTRALDMKGKDIGIQNRGPRVAVDRQKRIYVSAPHEGNLLLAVSTDRGKTFSKPTVIPDAPDAVHATAAGAGDLHVAWLGPKALFHARFDSGGKRIGKPVIITGLACEHCPPGLAVDPAGQPTVVWRESKTPRSVYLSRSTDGGRSFAAPVQLNSIETGLTECPQDAPAATTDGKTFAAAWMDRRDVERDADVYWVFGPPGRLSNDTDCLDDRRYQQRRPSLAIDADGVVWCAWEDSRLSALRVFYTHSKMEKNVPLEGPGAWPSLAVAGAQVAVAYQAGPHVAFHVLGSR